MSNLLFCDSCIKHLVYVAKSVHVVMHASLILSAHAHNTEYYGLVKVVNNASGTRLAGSYSQTGMQSPLESVCKIPIST